jgi:hypothetical protein
MPTYRRRPTVERPKPEPEVEPEYYSNASGKRVNDMIEQTPLIESHRQFFNNVAKSMLATVCARLM